MELQLVMTHQCVRVAPHVVPGLIGQVLALVHVVATMKYYLRVDWQSSEQQRQRRGDDVYGPSTVRHAVTVGRRPPAVSPCHRPPPARNRHRTDTARFTDR